MDNVKEVAAPDADIVGATDAAPVPLPTTPWGEELTFAAAPPGALAAAGAAGAA